MLSAEDLLTIHLMGKSVGELDGAPCVKTCLRQGRHLASDSHIKQKITSAVSKSLQMFQNITMISEPIFAKIYLTG